MPQPTPADRGLFPVGRRDLTPLEQTLAHQDPVIVDPQGYPLRPGPHPQFEGRWPNPNLPLSPWYPHGAEPRQFYPFAGYNLVYNPRGESGISITPFQVLRTLADTSDVLRVLIEDTKSQVQGMRLDFAAADDVSQSKTSEIAAVKQFMRKPDGIHDWNAWLTALMEDLLVTDAVSVYRWRTQDGSPLAMLLLDGTTIKPLVDFHGLPPAPPEPAYQQVILGRVETEFTRAWGDADPFDPDGNDKIELSYLPRNARTWSMYGQSPVERVLIIVNLALRKQLHDLAYFTDGTMPDGLYKMPETWTAQQIKVFQEMFDELHAGESGQRRKLKFLPGGQGTGMESAKGAADMAYEFYEYMWRVGAWAFGLSPLPIAKQMNRAVAQQMDASETDSGLRPTLKWLAESVVGPLVEQFLGYADIKAIFTDEKASDEKVSIEKYTAYVREGIMGRGEVRAELGLDNEPADGEPLLVDTPTGPVKVPTQEDLDAKDEQAAAATAALAANPASKPNDAPGGEKGGSPPPPPGATPAPPTKEALADLKLWRKVAARDLRAKRAPRDFHSDHIPDALRTALQEWVGHCQSEEDIRWGFSVLCKSRRPLVAARRRIRHEEKLRKVIAAHFRARAPHLAVALEPAYARRQGTTRKSDEDEDAAIDQAMEWKLLVKKAEEPIADAYLDGETIAADAGGLEIAFGLTSEQATQYAAERGAELIGMRLVGGKLVDNPDAKWSVPQSTRDDIKQLLEKSLADGDSLRDFQKAIELATMWTWRAEMVARTEVAFALNAGAIDTYDSAGIEKVTVLDGPGCLADGHDDSEPGVNGEVWTLDEANDDPLGHPNCRRDFAPVVEGGP